MVDHMLIKFSKFIEEKHLKGKISEQLKHQKKEDMNVYTYSVYPTLDVLTGKNRKTVINQLKEFITTKKFNRI